IAAGIKIGKKTPRELYADAASVSFQSQPRPGDFAGNSAAVRISSPSDPATGADGINVDPLQNGDAASSSAAAAAPRSPDLETEQGETLANDDDDNGDDPPGVDEISAETFRECAALDQSDVDNGKRLIAYFGRDLLVRQEDDVPAGQILAWTG